MKSVFVTEILNKRAIATAKKFDCERIVYFSGKESLLDDIVELDSLELSHLDLEAEWLGWEMAQKYIGQVSNLHPRTFFIDGLDLTRAVIKAQWWSLYKHKGRIVRYADHLIERGDRVVLNTSYCLPCRLRNKVTVVPDRQLSRLKDTLKVVIAYLSLLVQRNPRRKSMTETRGGSPLVADRLVFFAKSIKQLELFGNVFALYGHEKVLACIDDSSSAATNELLDELDSREICYVSVPNNYSINRGKQQIKLLVRLLYNGPSMRRSFGARETYMLQQQLLHLLNRAYNFRSICSNYGPAIFLTNAFEVKATADLLVQVAHSYGAKVVNTMNGIKIARPINKDTQFDSWCVWTRAQKRMLVDELNIPAKQLIITGHLRADIAYGYEYKGTFERICTEWPGKKIIAIFSQPQDLAGSYRESFFSTVRSYLRDSPDVIGILKPHPREDFENLKNLPNGVDRLIIVPHDDREPTTQLYDLLQIADLTVVMFSTVALQSLFFQTPVVSLDYTGVPSLLPIVDGKWIKKTTTEQVFTDCVNEFLFKSEKVKADSTSLSGAVDGQAAHRTVSVIKSCLKHA